MQALPCISHASMYRPIWDLLATLWETRDVHLPNDLKGATIEEGPLPFYPWNESAST